MNSKFELVFVVKTHIPVVIFCLLHDDWLNQDQVKAEIRMGIRNVLRKADFPLDKIEDVIPIIMQQTENNYRDVGFDNKN